MARHHHCVPSGMHAVKSGAVFCRRHPGANPQKWSLLWPVLSRYNHLCTYMGRFCDCMLLLGLLWILSHNGLLEFQVESGVQRQLKY